MKKILLVTEYLNPPFDEGIKKTAYNLLNELENRFDVYVICRQGYKKENIEIVKTNRLFLSIIIKKIIYNFKPDLLIYFPFASSTFASYLRLIVLKLFSKNAKSVFIALQPKPLNQLQKYIVKLLKPVFALTPSPELKSFWDHYKIKNELLPLLTDLSIFKPLQNSVAKKLLREKYNLPVDSYIISHMGHLNKGRNLRSLIPLQQAGNQVVIVVSSSTPKDAIGPSTLKFELKEHGIIIVDEYIEAIAEIYQLSDLYIFPVLAKNSSIGLPLSVLEARACGIPVLTTDYGSIKHFLGSDQNSIFYSFSDNFTEAVNGIKKNADADFTNTRITELNEQFYNIIYNVIGS